MCYYIHRLKKITDQQLAELVRQCFFAGWQTGLGIMREANQEDFKMTKQEVEQLAAQTLAGLITAITEEYKEKIITP